MRTAVAIGLLLLTAACQDEPDFEERYETASGKIEQTSVSIEKDLQAAGKRPVPAVSSDGEEPEN